MALQEIHVFNRLRSLWHLIAPSLLLPLLAETYGNLGRPDEGLTALAEAEAAVDKTGERLYAAELRRLKGELLLIQAVGTTGQLPLQSKAEDCFRQALDMARHQGAKSLELRVAMSLSRLGHYQGKQEEACQLLAEVYRWVTEGFNTADLQEAKALLEELRG